MNAAYQKLCARLMMAGVPDARFDAAQLYTFVTGRDHRLDDGPTAEEASRLQVLAERRAGREPLQYLLGEWDFLDFTLKVGRGVLCPRADSEVVCETAIELLKDSEAPVVYDLCAGTGCLGLGIARAVPSAKVTCVELSHDAWPYLTANVAALGGKTTQAERGDVMNYYTQIEPESADLIISNPPYLTAREMQNLMPETAREPAMALTAWTFTACWCASITMRCAPAAGWCWRSATPRPRLCWSWARLLAGRLAPAARMQAAMTG